MADQNMTKFWLGWRKCFWKTHTLLFILHFCKMCKNLRKPSTHTNHFSLSITDCWWKKKIIIIHNTYWVMWFGIDLPVDISVMWLNSQHNTFQQIHSSTEAVIYDETQKFHCFTETVKNYSTIITFLLFWLLKFYEQKSRWALSYKMQGTFSCTSKHNKIYIHNTGLHGCVDLNY